MKYLLLFLLALPLSAAATDMPVCAYRATTLRKGPGLKYPISWHVPKYMPFLRVGQKGAWDKVRDLEGAIHWAKRRDLSTNLSCVVVRVPVATMRSGPSRASPLADLRSLDRYTPLKRVGSQGPWVHVMDEAHHNSWVYETLVWHPVRIESFSF